MCNYDQVMKLSCRLTCVIALAVPTLAACGSSSPVTARAAPSSGITGSALVGPTCPVERVGHRCERGYQTTIAVYTSARPHHLVTRFHTTADGRFLVRLAPGRYRLAGAHAGVPRLTPVLVAVRTHRFTTITIAFDTGIR